MKSKTYNDTFPWLGFYKLKHKDQDNHENIYISYIFMGFFVLFLICLRKIIHNFEYVTWIELSKLCLHLFHNKSAKWHCGRHTPIKKNVINHDK